MHSSRGIASKSAESCHASYPYNPDKFDWQPFSGVTSRQTRSRRLKALYIFSALCILVLWRSQSSSTASRTDPVDARFSLPGRLRNNRLVSVQDGGTEKVGATLNGHETPPVTIPEMISDLDSPDRQEQSEKILHPTQPLFSPDRAALDVADHGHSGLRSDMASRLLPISSTNNEDQELPSDNEEISFLGGNPASHLTHAISSPTQNKDLQLDEGTDSWLPLAAPVIAEPDSQTTSVVYQFPDSGRYQTLNEMADELPDFVHIPLLEAVQDEVLEGWEDEWFSDAHFDAKAHGALTEPSIDFVYTWVNGSDQAFVDTMRPFEQNSSLNDPAGEWIASHGVNRYRDWDELRYSIRSVEKYASSFRNKIQLLVNLVQGEDGRLQKQRPTWLKDDAATQDIVQVLAQDDFFGTTERDCLPTFNSLTIENQIFNTPSDTDHLFALSDDMFLGKPHAASDIYSPLFGTVMGFKSNAYNSLSPPSERDALRFGEKPYLIYTSWMLNRRFGSRKRKGQVHFGHSLSRSVAREAISTFPRPALKSACQKFRGETGFQLYSWYAAFHYTIERYREALLWSYLMIRSDPDSSGNLDWEERQIIMKDLEEGIMNEGHTSFRTRMFYYIGKSLELAGLQAPKVNVEATWTSLDGPVQIENIECYEFDVNECLAPGFSSPLSDKHYSSPVFSTAAIFDRVSRQNPQCGDCLIKLLLNRVGKGLSPLLPDKEKSPEDRVTVIKALKRYQYVVVEPDALFTMVTDAEQVQVRLVDRLSDPKKQSGQLCLNDDVATESKSELEALRRTMLKLFRNTWGEPSAYEKPVEDGDQDHIHA